MKLRNVLLLSAIIGSSLFAQAKESEEAKVIGSLNVQQVNKSKYAKVAKISLNDAISIAKKQIPGRVREANLENEDGYLVYSVLMVARNSELKEILVDAGNGKILSVGSEDKDGDLDD